MIVPGSASFPAIASLGRRLLPALSVVRCTVCVAPDSDHDPDRAFFFYSLLSFTFGFPSHFAHCSMFVPLRFHSVRSLERHCTCPSPSFIHPHLLGFLAHMSVWFYTHPLLARFWLHSPSPPLSASPIVFPSLLACASRDQGLSLAFCLRRTRDVGGIHVHLRRWRTLCLSIHPIAGFVLSRRHHHSRRITRASLLGP